jgi:hypothetical protein
VIAMLRVILTSFNTIVDQTVKFTDFPEVALLQDDFFIFGLVIWGNLIDNAVNPKGILIICEVYFAVSLVFVSFFYSISQVKSQDQTLTYDRMIGATFTNEFMSRTFYSGIEVITIVQLFNWFPRKLNGTILFAIKIIQPLTFGLQFVIGGFL